MKVEHSIEVQYQSTNDPKVAQQLLNSLPNVFSADFETAIRYSKEVLQLAEEKAADKTLPRKDRIRYQAIANATALGHPSHCTITHCSIAWSEKDAYVFIIDSQAIADVVLDFLVQTKRIQIWHNYSYDGRFLVYYGGGQPEYVEDTQIMAKTLINHVETFKAKTGLKELAGAWYGDWGISADNFTLEQQYDEHVIKYAAIDACATYKLWEYLNDFIDNQ